MPEPQVTVRTTEAGRVTEVVLDLDCAVQIVRMVRHHAPNADVRCRSDTLAIRQPGGPDVVALAGETLRIAAGRVERVQ